MECLFQVFQVFGSNGIITCNDIVNHSGSIEEVSNDYRSIQIIIHGFITLFTHSFHIYAGCSRRDDFFQSVYGIHHSAQPFFCSLQSFVAEVYRTAVVSLQDEEADGHRAVSLCQQLVCAVEELIQIDEVTI